MGDFLLYNKEKFSSDTIAKSIAMLKRQGSEKPIIVEHSPYIVHFYPKRFAKVGNFQGTTKGDFCGSSGTFFYQNRFGVEALTSFHDEFDVNEINSEDYYGVFTLLCSKNGRLHLITDPLGCSRVYHDRDFGLLSSSFLAVCAAAPRLTPNSQAVYEYAFQQTTYGKDTLFEEISCLDGLSNLMLDQGVCRSVRKLLTLDFQPSKKTFDDLVSENAELLQTDFRRIVDHFGNKVTTALSGGFDSRLILGLLRDQQCQPKVYVYGGEDISDVQVAKAIATGEKIELKHVNKSRYERPKIVEFSDVIANNFFSLDGFPTEGIFDFGADRATRLDRAEDGSVLLNGGGGEIYRNFFGLAQRPWLGNRFSVDDLIRTFYSRWTRSICQDNFSPADYRRQLGEKIKHAVGLESSHLDRGQLEYAYPAFRLRHWTSKDNSNNTRLGSFITPFISYNAVRFALKIPIEYKNYGLLQAAMIQHIDPKFAAYLSDYGYSFNQSVPMSRKLKENLIYWRPVFLRQYTYAVRHWLLRGERPDYVSAKYLREVFDPSDMMMSAYFRLDRIKDPGLFSRICTMEYLYRYF